MVQRISLLAITAAAIVAVSTSFDGRGGGSIIPKAYAQRASASPALTPSDDSADAVAFASIAAREVSQLNNGVILAKWMNTRGKSERWDSRKPEEMAGGPDPECLSLRRLDALPSGAVIARALYFYPPPVPSPLVFPTTSGSELFETCTLAVVRVEVEAANAEFGRAMTQAVSLQFTKIYGESVGEKGSRLRRAGVWDRDGSRWVSHAEIISNYDAKPGLNPNAPGQLLQGPVARVFAQVPNIADLGNRSPMRNRSSSLEQVEFRNAVAAARVDARLSERMEKLYLVDTNLSERLQAEAEEICKTRCLAEAMPKPTGNEWREPLLPLLQDWFQALKTADAGHRAAGLVAADHLLKAFGSIRPWNQFGTAESSTAEQSKLRSALQQLGATFGLGYAEDFERYSGNWLDQAKDLDLDSQGGRLALLTWMSEDEGCARSGSEDFRKVISLGEALLAKKIDAPTAARVHFMVGDAYSDLVAISGGVDPNGAYTSSDMGDEAASRGKALQQYRAGLALDRTSKGAKEAWGQAWHLAAGLVPGTRYACFGD
jgi:hypothetical protein